MSYTPTSWTTGDTITASALNKIEQGIANAGGGGGGTEIEVTESSGTFTLDASYNDIKQILLSGSTPFFMYHYQTEGFEVLARYELFAVGYDESEEEYEAKYVAFAFSDVAGADFWTFTANAGTDNMECIP